MREKAQLRQWLFYWGLRIIVKVKIGGYAQQDFAESKSKTSKVC